MKKEIVKTYHDIEFMNIIFTCERRNGKKGKFEKDLEKAMRILKKPAEMISAAERYELINIYNVAYHTSGKIENIYSLDSSATNCPFCVKMRKAAEFDPSIICALCYDFKQEHSFKGLNTLNRHSLNMIIMSTLEFTVEELSILPGSGFIRVNSSGDAPNKIYACNMIKYAIAHSYANVAIWSKNTAAYIYACDKYEKPENVILIQSSIFINKPVKLAKYFDYTFTVYNDENAVKMAIVSGACECNGKKCMKCGYKCYKRAWKSGADIAELLRK